MIDLIAIASQGEAHFRVHQGNTGKLLHDVAHLSLGRFEEVASGGHVEKQILHREGSAGLHRCETLFLHHRAFVDNPHSHLVFPASRLQLHLGNGCDAGQSLASEAHCANGEEVLGLADLRSSVPLEAQTGVSLRHAAAVVNDHNHRLAGILHHQVYLGGSGIQGVLHQFLDGRCRTLNHLASRNLVGDTIRKKFNDI